VAPRPSIGLGGYGALRRCDRGGEPRGRTIKNKVDVQHGLENAPATLRRLFEGRNEGKQLLRVVE
jgi:hypothetical protein